MAEASRNKLSWRIMAPVAIFAIFQSAFMAFSTVLADIAKVFPNESPTFLQTILTVPSLMSIPISLLAGVLASYITKKSLVIFALICELIGGCIPLLAHGSVAILLLSSAFIGIGQGFLISISSAILAERFDGSTKGWAMGFRQAATSIGITGLTVLTGFLCELAWWKSYFVYLLVIPILILTVIMLPKGGLDARLLGKGLGLTGLKRVFTPGMIYWCVMLFFLGCFSFAFYLNVGMSITSKNLGGASAIGLATAWSSLLTIVVAMGFGVVLKTFRKFTMAAGMLFFAAAYLIIFGATSLVTMTIGGIVYGIATGIQMPGSAQFLTETVDRESSTMALAVSNACISLGITLSPVIVNALAAMFGPIDGTTGMLAAAIGYGVLLVAEIVYELLSGKPRRAV
jgi:MFS family permease